MSAPTLDQLRLFVAVVDEGSFSAAARRVGRAQSAVSYGIANLERQLGISLFDRGGRRPALSEAGRGLVRDARHILARVGQLQHRAAGVAAGLEVELSVAVDAIVPAPLLVDTCRAFHAAFPSVALQLHAEVLSGVAGLVRAGTCDIGIGATVVAHGGGLRARFLTRIALVPVAATDHPLAALPAPIPGAHAAEHVQIVISEHGSRSGGPDYAVLGSRIWRVADVTTKHTLICAGLGWGTLPAERVAADIDDGRLVALVLEPWGREPLLASLSSIVRDDAPPGPAGQWMVDHLPALCAGYAPTTVGRIEP